jgi:hypothetical protein
MLMQIALVSRTNALPADELMEVSAALQKQVARDVGPLWGIQATVDGFSRIEDVPSDYWRVVVEDFAALGGEAGVHLAPHDGQPYARVPYSNMWPLVASHETIEMLVDPSLNRLRAGDAVDGSDHRVRYLVEVCDPCQAPEHGYTVNGVLVSDFAAPWYYDPVAVPGIPYSFCGRLSAPRDIAEGGYLTWFDPELDRWRQAARVGGRLSMSDLAVPPSGFVPLRERINRVTRSPYWWTHGIDDRATKGHLKALCRARPAARKAHTSTAKSWVAAVYDGRDKASAPSRKRAGAKVHRGK